MVTERDNYKLHTYTLQTHDTVWFSFLHGLMKINNLSVSGGANVKRADFLSCFVDIFVHKCKIIIGCWPAVLVRSVIESSHVQQLHLKTRGLQDMKRLWRRKKIQAMYVYCHFLTAVGTEYVC